MRELRSTGPEKEIHLKVRKNRVRESRDDQVFNLLTLLVLMLVNLVIANAMSAWYVILMRSYFENSIPAELFEASEIDGCSVYRQLWSITLPLSGPIFAVIALYTAVDIWISYFDSLIDINDKSTFPCSWYCATY